jgi:hypothetical protein
LPKGSGIQGLVVGAGSRPRANAQLTLVSASQNDVRKPVTADSAGRFDTRLPAGTWLVYSRGGDGNSVYHGKLELSENQTKKITVTGSK